jgi:hypothetical protein
MGYLKTNKLYCFSPPVMLATFIIEIALAIYTLYRYRFDKLAKLCVALLVLLALFQFAEFNVCGQLLGLDSLTWSRLGYVCITFLPVIGVHALLTIARKKAPLLVAGLYSIAAVFATYFLTVGHGLTSSVCTGNYVIFEVNPNINTLYMLYYYGLELFALYMAWSLAQQTKQKKQRRALYGLTIGYLCLLMPTTTVNIIAPETVRGIPSIMCGFAVLLAIVIAVVVLPSAATPRRKNSLMTRLFRR